MTIFTGKDGHAQRSEERFSRNAETDIVCRLLLEKKKQHTPKPTLQTTPYPPLYSPLSSLTTTVHSSFPLLHPPSSLIPSPPLPPPSPPPPPLLTPPPPLGSRATRLPSRDD